MLTWCSNGTYCSLYPARIVESLLISCTAWSTADTNSCVGIDREKYSDCSSIRAVPLDRNSTKYELIAQSSRATISTQRLEGFNNYVWALGIYLFPFSLLFYSSIYTRSQAHCSTQLSHFYISIPIMRAEY